jgi:chorismate dehydratase
VLLVSRKQQLENIRSVALDESSRTSATLVKIIFREFLRRDAEWTTRSPDLDEMLERNDAALIIGDPAMVFTRGDLRIWDMASLWRNYTGLGFVFAMWMLNDSAMDRVRTIDFAAARAEGVENKPEIISEYQKLLGLSRGSLQDYLDNNICFRLDNQMQQGLNLYYELAHKNRLIEVIKPLRMLEPLVEASL